MEVYIFNNFFKWIYVYIKLWIFAYYDRIRLSVKVCADEKIPKTDYIYFYGNNIYKYSTSVSYMAFIGNYRCYF